MTSSLAALAVALSTNIGGAIITVNGQGGVVDDGNCTLAEAVAAANSDAPVDACVAGSGPDVIVFDPSLGTAIDLTGVSSLGASPIIIDPSGTSGAHFTVNGTVGGGAEIDDVDIIGLDVSGSCIDAGAGLTLARVSFLDDHCSGGIVAPASSTFSALSLTDVDVEDLNADFGFQLQWHTDSGASLTRVAFRHSTATALDLAAGNGSHTTLTDVTVEDVHVTEFNPVIIIDDAPAITGLTLTNVDTVDDHAVKLLEETLGDTSIDGLVVDTCNAVVDCVNVGGGTVRNATMTNVAAPFALAIGSGLDATVVDTIDIEGSAGGLTANASGGSGGIAITNVTQVDDGAIDRGEPTMLLQSEGSEGGLTVSHVHVTRNVVAAGAGGALELFANGAAASLSASDVTLTDCTGPASLLASSTGITDISIDRATITGAVGSHAFHSLVQDLGGVTASRMRLEQNPQLTGAQALLDGGLFTEGIVVGGNAIEANFGENFVHVRNATIALASTGIACTGNVQITNTLIGPDVATPDASSAGNACDFTGFTPGNGNLIGVDPQYTAPTLAGGDFTVQAGSPAIDAGQAPFTNSVSTIDFAGNARIQGPTVDVGAFEFPEATGEGEGEGEGAVGEGEGEGATGEGEGANAGEGEGAAGEGEGEGEGEGHDAPACTCESVTTRSSRDVDASLAFLVVAVGYVGARSRKR